MINVSFDILVSLFRILQDFWPPYLGYCRVVISVSQDTMKSVIWCIEYQFNCRESLGRFRAQGPQYTRSVGVSNQVAGASCRFQRGVRFHR